MTTGYRRWGRRAVTPVQHRAIFGLVVSGGLTDPGRCFYSVIRRFWSNVPDYAVLLAGAIGVQGVSHENANADDGQQGCDDLGHRRLPWVIAMPMMAVMMKWR